MPAPKINANSELRNRPRTRLTIKEPVRIMVARAMVAFCIEPLSCARKRPPLPGTATVGNGLLVSGTATAGNGLLGMDKGKPEGPRCNAGGCDRSAFTGLEIAGKGLLGIERGKPEGPR